MCITIDVSFVLSILGIVLAIFSICITTYLSLYSIKVNRYLMIQQSLHEFSKYFVDLQDILVNKRCEIIELALIQKETTSQTASVFKKVPRPRNTRFLLPSIYEIVSVRDKFFAETDEFFHTNIPILNQALEILKNQIKEGNASSFINNGIVVSMPLDNHNELNLIEFVCKLEDDCQAIINCNVNPIIDFFDGVGNILLKNKIAKLFLFKKFDLTKFKNHSGRNFSNRKCLYDLVV